jgi:diguanylate cyclase (GGDEF)-like protein
VTSLSNPADVIEGMHAGADDYVAKPLNPLDLEARLLAARRVTELHAELAAAREALALQASTDPMTGLRNRLTLTQDLDQVHSSSERYRRSYCLALCDVDFFKRYNDTHGHLAGDTALRQVAVTLQRGVRESDLVYRYGGEEFLIILPEQATPEAMIALERILAQVRALRLEHRAGGPAGILTLSVGMACFIPGHAIGSPALLAQADHALYLAKSAGRDRIVVAGS